MFVTTAVFVRAVDQQLMLAPRLPRIISIKKLAKGYMYAYTRFTAMT